MYFKFKSRYSNCSKGEYLSFKERKKVPKFERKKIPKKRKKERMEDENVELPECFNWSVKWRSAPTYTICAINEIVQQLSRTRVREQMMGKTTESTCRICHQFPETVEHILAGCPGLAQRKYLWRHNDALKHVLNVILLQHGLREKPLGHTNPTATTATMKLRSCGTVLLPLHQDPQRREIGQTYVLQTTRIRKLISWKWPVPVGETEKQQRRERRTNIELLEKN